MKKHILFIGACLLIACVICGCSAPNAPGSTQSTAPQPSPQTETIVLNLVTQRRFYDISGNLLSVCSFTYDENGLLLSEEQQSMENRAFNCRYEYVYNDHGHLISRTEKDHLNQVTDHREYTYSYHSDGKVSSVTGLFGESELLFEYDKNGRLLRATTPFFDGTQWEYFLCQYGENNKPSLVTISAPNSKDDYTFVYNNRNQLINVIDKFGERSEYEYDSYGNLIRENSHHFTYSAPDGVLTSIVDTNNPDITYILDRQGRISAIQENDRIRTEYEYQTIELSSSGLGMSRKYWSLYSRSHTIGRYYNDILAFLLPRAPGVLLL
jgi:YD repeat-containing protein